MGDEDNLIDRAKIGDADAFARLVAPHLGQARQAACSVGAQSDAEDAVQNALLKAHRSLRQFDDTREFRPWFLAIVRHEAINLGRVNSRQTRVSDRLGAQPIESVTSTAEDDALARLDRERVLAAVRRLSAEDQATLGARFLEQQTEAETAARLGLPVGTVKSRTSRALRRLQLAMVALAVVLAVVLIGPVRRAVAHWLGLSGVRIERISPTAGEATTSPVTKVSIPDASTTATTAAVEPSAPASTAVTAGSAKAVVSPSSSTAAERDPILRIPDGFGVETTSMLARVNAGFAFGVLRDARLGPADKVSYAGDVGDGLVTFWWKPTLTFPPSVTDAAIGAAFSALKGRAEDYSFSKLVGANTTVSSVTVNGDPGYWLEGAPHQLAISSSIGVVLVNNHLSTNTLVWQHDQVTYRLEAHVSKALALELATSLTFGNV